MAERVTQRRNTAGPGSAIGDRGQHTKRRLVEAATKVFARRGLHGARIEEIAAVAKVSRGAFYQYFDSKDSVFTEVLHEVEKDVLDTFASLREVTADLDGYQAIQDWIDTYLTVCDKWLPMLRVFVENESPDSPHGHFGAQLVTKSAQLLARRLRGGLPPEVDSHLTAVALLAMVDRFSYASAAYHLDVGRVTVVHTLAVVAFRMVHPEVDLDARPLPLPAAS
ncbi:TetR/AcrR family transcriptional regulator [Pseudofrankia inefficax]|uniref:TetR/AcrR family transcriptional regulator n=1 Tax=Pseudofrankia inefficax (strain DSM 45817 / CECT 9037 / DDB 130130 / EuI1c) TaxID=298654 RepID=UPI0012FE59AC|nr:TetR/AcrR family transcriptional regulator [Pseudofrankia inefficax]